MPVVTTRVTFRPMTDLERRAVSALDPVTFPVASFWKRLRRSLAGQAAQENPTISDRQAACLWKTVWRFRRQVLDQTIVAEAESRISELRSRGIDPIPGEVGTMSDQKPARTSRAARGTGARQNPVYGHSNGLFCHFETAHSDDLGAPSAILIGRGIIADDAA